MSRKILYLDTFSGISGDMFLAALADAGYDPEGFNTCIQALNLPNVRVSSEKGMKQVISATHIQVHDGDSSPPLRKLPQIRAVLEASRLNPGVRDRSLQVFQAIAEAEAAVHGTSVEDIHFHEIGAVDTLVDVCCTVQALHDMGIEAVYSSPLPMGRGFIKGEHGILPLPAPATAELLKDAALRPSEIERELVTPTGAALVKVLAESYGPMPAMTLRKTGWGAGTADLKIPNVLRVFIGESLETGTEEDLSPVLRLEGVENDAVLLLECNLDDMHPELAGALMDVLLEKGALDVWFTSVQMKKNRPGLMLSVLAKTEDGVKLAESILQESSTAGLRTQRIQRLVLPRTLRTIDSPYGPVRVKDLYFKGEKIRSKPEFDDCVKAAELSGLPLVRVIETISKLL